MSVPEGNATGTGVSLSVVLPCPSSPSSLVLQAYTCPLLVTARSNWCPVASPVTMVPGGKCTGTGFVLQNDDEKQDSGPVAVPTPSCPNVLSPQASNDPDDVMDRLEK